MADNYRRALMAFPDEDVLVGTRINRRRRVRGVQGADRHHPPARPQGLGRGAGLGSAAGQAVRRRAAYDDQTFFVTGDGSYPLVLDHESLKPETIDAEVAKLFKPVKPKQGDCLIAFGWMMAEDLLKFA